MLRESRLKVRDVLKRICSADAWGSAKHLRRLNHDIKPEPNRTKRLRNKREPTRLKMSWVNKPLQNKTKQTQAGRSNPKGGGRAVRVAFKLSPCGLGCSKATPGLQGLNNSGWYNPPACSVLRSLNGPLRRPKLIQSNQIKSNQSKQTKTI